MGAFRIAQKDMDRWTAIGFYSDLAGIFPRNKQIHIGINQYGLSGER
jgi:hypothetical protein